MAEKKYASQQLDRYIVKFPDGMRDQLKKAAKENNRSLNAEIIARLEGYEELASLNQTLISKIKEDEASQTIQIKLMPVLKKQLDHYSKISNVYATNYKVIIQSFSTMMLHLELFLVILTQTYNEKGKINIDNVNKMRSSIERFNQSIQKTLEESEEKGPPEEIPPFEGI